MQIIGHSIDSLREQHRLHVLLALEIVKNFFDLRTVTLVLILNQVVVLFNLILDLSYHVEDYLHVFYYDAHSL